MGESIPLPSPTSRAYLTSACGPLPPSSELAILAQLFEDCHLSVLTSASSLKDPHDYFGPSQVILDDLFMFKST